jgi:hypothetical protein
MGGSRGERPSVLVASSGPHSELVEKLAISREAGARREVAMSIRPGGGSFSAMPDLEPGDRLLISAEIELTTDCEEQTPDNCIGKAYTYPPTVSAELLLASGREVTEEPSGRAIRLERKSERCTHPEHHKVLVFPEVGYRVPDKGFPWPLEETCINLVLDAHSPRAQDGQFLLVGQNNPADEEHRRPWVGQSMGRLNLVRVRGELEELRREETRRPVVGRIPIDPDAKTVVYSLALKEVEEGEQLLVEAELTTDSRHLDYPARISTRVYLVDEPGRLEPGGRAKEAASFGGVIGEHNGFNSLPGSGLRTTRRAGVLRITKPSDKPLYVNLVATGGDPLRKAKREDALNVGGSGFVQAFRYPPELKR